MRNLTVLIQRAARKWHRKVSALTFGFFFIISATGILLGWKGLFATTLYKTATPQATAMRLKDWLRLDTLQQIAIQQLEKRVPGAEESRVVNLNARLDKGYARFTIDGYNVQLNPATGELQSIERRPTDLFVRIHDGEILDDLFHTNGEIMKTSYTSILALGLLFLTLTGFWMKFGRKKTIIK
jgi:hypothetical protein